jgi:hypothetical protein
MSLWLKKKTVAPTTIIEYLGLTIDTGKMIVKIPEHKISELKDKSMFAIPLNSSRNSFDAKRS